MENIKEIDIIITLVAGTLVMFIMAGVIVYSVIRYQKNVLKQKETLRLAEKKYQNDLLEAILITTEKERERIAKNMHDEIGTLLTVVKHNNSRLKNQIANGGTALELINTNNHLLVEITENVKALLNDLMSPTLSKLGFMRALSQLCALLNNSGSVKVILKPDGLNTRFSSDTEVQLFRVCKEIINNILKHSNSTEILINLTFDSETLSISIAYNGTGINDDEVKLIMKNSAGLGLKSIYSRIQILNGTLHYLTRPGENYLVQIQIPVKEIL